MKHRILIIEDDSELGSQIVESLRSEEFEPTWWRDGTHLLDQPLPDVAVVVLDLMLPGAHGFDILRAIRRTSEVPVLVLSARIGTEDKVRALQLGADDYMTKPFWPEEFVERVRARIRRPALAELAERHIVGPLSIDVQARLVHLHGEPLDLTRAELDVLLALARRPGAALTRQHLVEAALDPERGGTERTLDVHIARLRKKIGHADLIETVWGIGYRLAAGAAPCD